LDKCTGAAGTSPQHVRAALRHLRVDAFGKRAGGPDSNLAEDRRHAPA